MTTDSHLAIQKVSTTGIEAEGGLGAFLRRHFYLMLPVLLTFFVIAVFLLYALNRCLVSN